MHRAVCSAVRRVAIVCSFALAASASAQPFRAPAIDPAEADAKRQAFFEALRTATQRTAVDRASATAKSVEPSPEAPALPADTAPIDAPPLTDEANFVLGKPIQFEAAIIHLASPEAFSDEELAVTGESVDELLQDWKANGEVASMSTLRLSLVDEQEGFMTFGEQVPVTTARNLFGGGARGGPVQTSVENQDVGTLFGVRGRIHEDRIDIEVNIEQSRLEPAKTSPERHVPILGGADTAVVQEGESKPPAMQKVNSETVVTVQDGEKVILSAAFQQSPEGSSATIVTLKATILP